MEKNEYLHSSHENEESGTKEAERLRLLNLAYGPETHKVLSKYLRKGASILELGIGTGYNAEWFLQQIGENGLYIGVDKDHRQLEKAEAKVGPFKNRMLIQADVLTLSESNDLKNSQPADGFDLIYCRWLLCHFLSKDRHRVIKEILSLLKVGGVFICEEPDYRDMHLRVDGIATDSKAIESWKETVKTVLEDTMGLNLHMNAEESLKQFENINDEKHTYSIEIIGSFLAELKGEQKRSLSLGIETSKKVVLSVTNRTEKQLDDLKDEFDMISKDSNVTVPFYTNTFTKVTRIT